MDCNKEVLLPTNSYPGPKRYVYASNFYPANRAERDIKTYLLNQDCHLVLVESSNLIPNGALFLTYKTNSENNLESLTLLYRTGQEHNTGVVVWEAPIFCDWRAWIPCFPTIDFRKPVDFRAIDELIRQIDNDFSA